MKNNIPTKEVDNHGNIRYYLDGKYHREDDPAVEYYTGEKEWWLNGKLHRGSGPALEYANGHKEWWLHGEQIDCNSQEEFERLVNLRALW